MSAEPAEHKICARCHRDRPAAEFLPPRGRICVECRNTAEEGTCACCSAPVRRGQALCRPHWMALAHYHRVQIGNAMREEKDSGEGPDHHGRYHSDEYAEAVRNAVASLNVKDEETNAKSRTIS